MKKSIFLIVFLSGVCLANAQTPPKPEMILVEGGTFTMGSNNGEEEEKPTHLVTLSSFKISKYVVTVAQYKAFCQAMGRQMPDAPDWGWNDNHPMVYVNINDATAYCNWLSKEDGGNYRLPTEAEWEYAARGGNKSKGYIYSGSNDLEKVGWSAENSDRKIQAVCQKGPNELGLYDMSGNVFEWCSDWYGEYSDSSQTNPKGPASGELRVLRGGCVGSSAKYCRVTYRTCEDPNNGGEAGGFRVVSSL